MNTWREYLGRHLGEYTAFGLLVTLTWLGVAIFMKGIFILSDVALAAACLAAIFAFVKICELTNRYGKQGFIRVAVFGLLALMFLWGITSVTWHWTFVALTAALLIPVNLLLALVISWFVFELKSIEKRTP